MSSFDRPTIPDLKERLHGDIEGHLEDVDPRLRRAMVGGQVRAEAGVAHELHGHLDHISKQVVPSSADEEHLALHADWWGEDRNDAVAAAGFIDVVGTDGSPIPIDEELQRGDGVEYKVTAEATIVAGAASVAVICKALAQDGNADPGVVLTFVTPVPGVQSKTTVAAGGLTGGTDIEDVEDWRARFRDRVQNPPQGGSLADYKKWAREVPGVTRVWVFDNWLGIGTVGVFFVRDDDADFIPDAAEVQTVLDYIDERRPAGMKGRYVLAPVAVAVDMTIKLEPNTQAVQDAVTAEIADLFRREAQVEDGTGSGTLKLSRLDEAISLADGETDHELVAPAANPAFSAGEIGKPGTITFQSI